MDTFLEKYNLPKVNEEEAESLNRPITAEKSEAVIIKLPTHESPGLEGFTGEFQKAFKGELIPSFTDYSKKSKMMEDSFYEASIILIAKPDKDTTKNENYRPISLMNRH